MHQGDGHDQVRHPGEGGEVPSRAIEQSVDAAVLRAMNRTGLVAEARVKGIIEKEAYDTGRGCARSRRRSRAAPTTSAPRARHGPDTAVRRGAASPASGRTSTRSSSGWAGSPAGRRQHAA